MTWLDERPGNEPTNCVVEKRWAVTNMNYFGIYYCYLMVFYIAQLIYCDGEQLSLAYKKTWRCPGNTHTQDDPHSSLSFSAGELCCGAELLVLAGSSPWRALRRRVSGISEPLPL